MKKNKAVYISVSGRVQGVAFRHYARLEARRYGLVGWVRNVKDGTVELFCAGDEEQISRFLAWLKQGSPLAQVEQVKWQLESWPTSPQLDFIIWPTV